MFANRFPDPRTPPRPQSDCTLTLAAVTQAGGESARPSEFMRKDRAAVRLFFLSNSTLAPNLLPLTAHSQQDEVPSRAVEVSESRGEEGGGGGWWRTSPEKE